MRREDKNRAMTRHTPGPWGVGPTPRYLGGSQYKDGKCRHSDPLTIRSPAHTEEIATVWTYLLPTEANARLIAAAPDLLEASHSVLAHLQELRDAWERGAISENDGLGGTRSNRNVECLVQLHMAIAKAEGRSNG